MTTHTRHGIFKRGASLTPSRAHRILGALPKGDLLDLVYWFAVMAAGSEEESAVIDTIRDEYETHRVNDPRKPKLNTEVKS